MGHPLATLHLASPTPCALFWATKAVKIADYNRGFPSHNCLLLLQLFPPVRFALLSLSSALLFFFSSDTFTLPFGHLSPLWPFSPATSGHPSDTGHGDVFISCSSFISFCSFFFCFCFVLFLFLFHTSENICICAHLLHVLPLPPFPSSHLLPRLLPLCLPQSHSFSLFSLCRPSFGLFICCPLAPVCSFILFLFVFLFVLFSVSLCFLFSTPSPRDSQIC